MAKSVKIELHQAVVRAELLNGAGIVAACMGVAQGIASQSGPGYTVQRRQLSTRPGFIVFPSTGRAMSDNEQNNTLAKASRRRQK